jgi:nucleotide-binding universal stress UspA family protein
MAMKYSRILYCTDFSEDAEYAFQTALDMAERHEARLYVLHILHSSYNSIESPDKAGSKKKEDMLSPEILVRATKKLQEIYEPKLETLKNNYEFHGAWGVPFVEIVRFARVHQIDFIVLGAAGSSNIKRISFGSTAENVARRAHCTVLITRRPEKDF